MPTPEINDSAQNAAFIASFFGAIFGLSYAPKMTKGKALVALLTGWVVAIYGTPLFVLLLEHYLSVHVTEEVKGSIYFFSGLVALRLVPVILFHVEQLKNVKPFDTGDK